MNAHNYPQLQSLVGKTLSKIHMSDTQGDMLMLEFTDGTKLAVADYYGYEDRGHRPDELFVSINEHEL